MPRIVRFNAYEVDLPAGQLSKHGLKISLREKSFQVLEALLEHPGEVVTREELQRRLWRNEVFVDFDNNLNTAIARLREALCDSAEHPHFIETLPKRGYRFLAKVSEPPPQEEKPVQRARLLVLPFANLSGDSSQEYFSDAMTDEMITGLAASAPEQMAVIARTTAAHYKGTHKDVAHIGRELGVDYLVEGGIRRSNDHVAINVQLIQVSDQAHLFARTYGAGMADIFKLQSSIAKDIVEHINISRKSSAGPAPVRSIKKPTEDLEAYEAYTKGRYHLGTGTREGLTEARHFLETAIASDPEFADAYDALAETYWYLAYFGFMSPRKAFSAGIVHALRALEIDSARAETHALLGQFHKTAEYNWPEVHREMALALHLDPNSPIVRTRYAVSELMPHGRLEEAVAELECALDVDPLSPLARGWLGIMLVLSRHYERAIEEGRKVLLVDPNFFGAYFVISVCHRYQKKFEDSIAAQRKAVELSGGAAGMLGWLGLTLAGNGEIDEARDVLQRLNAMAEQGYVPSTSLAWIHLGLGELDAAFQWLDRAVDECDQFMMPIKSYAFLDPIRSDPRFLSLLRKMNLEP